MPVLECCTSAPKYETGAVRKASTSRSQRRRSQGSSAGNREAGVETLLWCVMAYFKPHLCSWGCRHAWVYLTDWKEEPEGACLHKRLRCYLVHVAFSRSRVGRVGEYEYNTGCHSVTSSSSMDLCLSPRFRRGCK